MDILTWIIVGLFAGFLASEVMQGSGLGIIGDIVVGVVGAFVGGFTFRALGWQAPFGGLAGVITVAFVGAVIVLLLLRLFQRARRPRR